MEIKQVKIGELKAAEYNPRKWDEKAIADLTESIKRFGIVDPIIANSAPERANIVIGGHFRLKVAKDLGFEEVPVVYLNLPDIKKEQELNLRLNRNLGAWDYDLLANLDEEMLLDAGFGQGELDEIFGYEIDEAFDLEKELEKILAGGERRVKDGDIWKLGEHKLIIGNSIQKENWQRLLGEEKFDFMFTDPPYKIGYGVGNRKQKKKGGTVIQKVRTYDTIGMTTREGKPLDEKSPIIKFGYKGNREYIGSTQMGGVPEYDEWLSIANEFQNPKGANVMIFENWKNVANLWQAIEKYWKIKNMVIWHLPNRHQGFSAKYKFFSKYDIAPLAGEGEINEESEEELENYLQEKGQKLLDTYDIILYGNQGKSPWDRTKGGKFGKITDHITFTASSEALSGQNIVFGVKPTQILVPYIKVLSPRDGIVMEPFGGSGSTIIASEIMKRKCRAIEISPIYGEVILRRWEKITGKTAEKIS